jgi:hypothetical protein
MIVEHGVGYDRFARLAFCVEICEAQKGQDGQQADSHKEEQ